MKKSIIFLLRISHASINGPLVGTSTDTQQATIHDVAPYCHLSALETCTTRLTAKLCMVKIFFGNCEPVTVHNNFCDGEKEGQKCQKKMLKGKAEKFQGFYNAVDKQARGFEISMEDGRTYGLGYTPSKFIRESMGEKAKTGQIE